MMKFRKMMAALVALCMALALLPGAVLAAEAETVPMYRLYNPNSGEHFYTGSVEERDNLVSVGWNYEGVAWNAPISGGTPVHRVFNPNSGDHHYTMSMEEVENLKAIGWQYEGVCWNSASEGSPQYRLYNPNADLGSHHYTSSGEERENLVSLGWKYEGIGWYGAQPSHTHKYTETVTKPTCEGEGYTTYTCSCGDSYADNYVEAKGHSWSGWATTREPTETSEGTAERKCSGCGTKETKTLDKLEPKPTEPAKCEHDYTRILVPATCIKDGYYACTCKLCGDYYEEFFSSKSNDYHAYSLVSSVPGDCSTGKDGFETYKCSVCGDSYTKTVTSGHSWVHHHTDEVGHNEVYYFCNCGWSVAEATINSSGLTPGKYLYTYHQKQYEGSDAEWDHDGYSSSSRWVVDIPASDYYECSVCGTRK